MTDPVTCSILPGAGPVCASDFTFSFMIPFKFQKDTPKPTNPDIKLTKLEAHTVYVRYVIEIQLELFNFTKAMTKGAWRQSQACRPYLYASFLKWQGHQGVFSLAMGTFMIPIKFQKDTQTNKP